MAIPVAIVQPPLVQLNGPYPSGAYLSAFFRGYTDCGPVRWLDLGNAFFRDLFSAAGLRRLFDLSRASAAQAADAAEAKGDAETAYQLRRYLSMEGRWVSWIDGITSILSSGDRELCHAFVRSPFAPRGARMDGWLASLDADPSPDDARILASLALEDLADYIAVAYDGEFSLIRYAESIASSVRSFAAVEAALDRPMVREFLEPLCARLLRGLCPPSPEGQGDRVLFCLSVPFPGCLAGALAIARFLRREYGPRALIALGGGYVNTELRNCDNDRLFSYIDLLSFDRGYGGYAALVTALGGSARLPSGVETLLAVETGAGETGAAAPTSTAALPPGIPRRLFCPPEWARFERDVTVSIAPDYADIDFSLYPRLADDPNPMHRLWSDGVWLKAYLAHGCYWHRCSFCDVSLDYVAAYLPVATRDLYRSLRAQAIAKRVRGIHLVDEAAPPRALRDFALENLRAARSCDSLGSGGDLGATLAGDPYGSSSTDVGLLPFWGNIRFEKTFSSDLAEFFSAGGLLGVSGGIEIASAEGFKSVDKGIDLERLVGVCAAFKEAGVLVHAYLIYGYWDEDAQGVIDSAETMRQLFAAGLVDSAFWHKFMLTRHSRVYGEWRAGKHRGRPAGSQAGSAAASQSAGLQPIDEPGDFADNDLRFAGEGESDRYTAPLDLALQAWMAGEGLEKNVRKWFPFPMPPPRVAADLIDRHVAAYEARRDAERNRPFEPESTYCWTASRPVPVAGGRELAWWHLGEEARLPVAGVAAEALVAALAALPADNAALAALPRAAFKTLRRHGLAKISLG